VSNLYWLSQITATERFLVGEKIFLLSQFLQYDCPILPGFVLSSSVFQDFLASLDDSHSLIGNFPQSSLHFNINNHQVLQAVASKSRQMILEAKLDDRIIAQFLTAAGQLNSPHLILRPSLIVPHYQQQGNLGLWRSQSCFCQKEAIAVGIKRVWADLFGAKSLLYWDKFGVSVEQIKLAILVQPISNAIASGTIEILSSQAIIQANWGLGHSLQRGEIETDRYIVNLATAEESERKIGFKTRSYRLQNTPATNEYTEAIEYYLLEKSQQEIAVLESSQIYDLIKLINKVVGEKPEIRYIEWILLPNPSNSTQNSFWLTQVNYCAATTDTSLATPEENTATTLLKGISASQGSVTGKVIVYSSSVNSDRLLPSGAILVTKEIQPQELSLLQNVGGIITEIGGQTSHGAILARELGIPALVAAAQATKILKTGETVTLDADRGIVSAAKTLARVLAPPQPNPHQAILQHYSLPVTTNVPLATQLMVNLSQVNSIEQVAKLPIDGVGLVRGEFAILEMLALRSLKEWLKPNLQGEFLAYLTAILRQFTQGFAPKPIHYRAIDFPLAEKARNSSVLGIRGMSYAYLQDATLFKLELAALKRVMKEGNTNLRLILPFVRSLQEWQFCRDLVQKAGLTNYPEFQLWMMAEVPSVIFLLPEYIAAGVQGITIGMNDLSQLLLGVDREQELAPQAFVDNSLALERAIAKLIKTAQTHQIPCSICLTAHAQQPNIIDKLIDWGISIISVEKQAVSSTYQAIARAEKRLLLQLIPILESNQKFNLEPRK
jgi:pyruvate, water dikinase